MSRVLVTGGTRDDVAPIATFIINVKKTNSHLFDKVIVFHNGIKAKDQKLMKKIMDVEFRLYKLPFSTKNGVVFNYFSPMVFCKYECIRLLGEYDEVVWSDYDVLIRRALDEITVFEEGVYWNITSSKKLNLGEKLYQNLLHEEIPLKYDMNGDGVCASLFVLKRGIGDPNILTDWCYKSTEKYDRSLTLPEEAIFCMMIQNFHIKFKALSMDTYSAPAESIDDKVAVLHAVGVRKFWNAISNPVWESNYAEWLQMGGTKYSEILKRFNRKFKLIKAKILGIQDSANVKSGK